MWLGIDPFADDINSERRLWWQGSDKWLRERKSLYEFSFVGFRHLELYDAVLILQKGQQVSRIKLKFNMHKSVIA